MLEILMWIGIGIAAIVILLLIWFGIYYIRVCMVLSDILEGK